MQTARPRIAFVIQRYGREVVGGAESLCRALAEQLCTEWEITVLTTCARDYQRWRNAYPPGTSELNGVRVERFAVAEERLPRRFNRQDRWLLNHPHRLEDEHHWMRLQGPYCP